MRTKSCFFVLIHCCRTFWKSLIGILNYALVGEEEQDSYDIMLRARVNWPTLGKKLKKYFADRLERLTRAVARAVAKIPPRRENDSQRIRAGVGGYFDRQSC